MAVTAFLKMSGKHESSKVSGLNFHSDKESWQFYISWQFCIVGPFTVLNSSYSHGLADILTQYKVAVYYSWVLWPVLWNAFCPWNLTELSILRLVVQLLTFPEISVLQDCWSLCFKLKNVTQEDISCKG